MSKSLIADTVVAADTSSYQGSSAAVVPSFSAIEQLRFMKQRDGSSTYISDQYLLLNQERIRNVLGDDTFRSIMASFNQAVPSSSPDIPEQFQMMAVRSRFVQAPSEISAWISELSDRASVLKDKLDSDMASYIESLKTEVAKSDSSTDDSPSNTSE